MNSYMCSLIISIIFSIIFSANGHGRLVDPPGRSSAWRYGFKTAENDKDDQLWCGGFQTQYQTNGGKCGICGDPYNGVRDNEVPNGKYAKNLVISKNYKSGAVIDVKVEITIPHKGYFEFKLCPTTSDTVEVTQQCLDEHPLKIVSNSSTTAKFTLPSNVRANYTVPLQLPAGLTSKRAVLQWTYTSGTNKGTCADGKVAEGCGPQTLYMACGDVAIE